jgi:hypothetical protein
MRNSKEYAVGHCPILSLQFTYQHFLYLWLHNVGGQCINIVWWYNAAPFSSYWLSLHGHYVITMANNCMKTRTQPNSKLILWAQLSQLSRSDGQGIYRTKIIIVGSSWTRHCTLSCPCPYTSFIFHPSLELPRDFSNLSFSNQNFVPSSHVPCVLHRLLIPKRVIVKASVKTPK